MLTKRKNAYPLDQSPLYRLRSRSRLAKLLRLTPGELEKLARGDNRYSEWDQTNHKGKTRHIENPHHFLKKAQGRLAALLSKIEPPDFLFCPVKGRSYVTNAKHHVNGDVVVSLDIRAYYPSTSSRRVFWFFNSVLECERDIAGLLTALATWQARLPTGSPLSPILSFYAHVDMWQGIARLVREQECTLSVYIDDLSISGKNVPDRLLWNVKQQIHRCGLRYHKEKHYCGGAKEVTGVIIRDGELTLPNRQHLKIHQLRQSLQTETDQEERNTLLGKLRGCLAQANQITRENTRESGKPTKSCCGV